MDKISVESSLFEWATDDMDIKTFLERYKKNMPIVIRVTEGYAGADPVLSYSSTDIFWIYAVETKTKIMTRDKLKRHVSIPLESQLRFQLLQKTLPTPLFGTAVSLQQIIQETGGGLGQTIIFEKNRVVSIMCGPDEGNTAQFGWMEIVDVYEETHLLGHSILDNKINSVVHAIPVYVPIKLTTAVGLRNRTLQQYELWKESVEKMIETHFSIQGAVKPLTRKILVFDELDTSNTYDYRRPKTVLYEKASLLENSKQNSTLAAAQRPSINCLLLDHDSPKKDVHLPEHAPPPLPARTKKQPLTESFSLGRMAGTHSHEADKNGIERRVGSTGALLLPAFKSSNSTMQPNPIKKPERFHEPKPKKEEVQVESELRSKQPIGKISPLLQDKLDKNDGIQYSNWKTLNDVPTATNIAELSVGQVAKCLELLKLSPDKVKKFRDSDIDGSLLLSLDDKVLVGDFGFSMFDAKKLMKFAKENWRPNTTRYV